MYELGHCAYTAGRVGEAAAHFESALDCVETAPNAREALRKALAALHAGYPDEPAVLQTYARVTSRVDGPAGDAEACAAAGRAAELLEARGAPASAAKAARQLCPLGVREARRAAAVPPGLPGAARCDAAIPEVLRQLAALRTTAQRSALGTQFVQQMGASCRGHSGYVKAINALQTADPYNPHLHVEWARLLREMLLHEADADTHMAVGRELLVQAAAGARAAGAHAQAEAAERQAEQLRREHAGWAGVPSGPRSVKKLIDSRLKEEL